MITLLIIAIAVFVGDIIIQRLIAQRLPSNKLPVRWSDGSACSLTGLQIMRQNLHPAVTIHENMHPQARGATYYARQRTIVVAPQDFNASDFDTLWRTCHELRHPDQTSALWRRVRSMKIWGEILYGVSLGGSVSRLWLSQIFLQDVVLGLFGFAALSYFVGNTMPEWDAVLATPLIWRQCGLAAPSDSSDFEQIQGVQWSHLLIYFSTVLRMICAGAIALAVTPILIGAVVK